MTYPIAAGGKATTFLPIGDQLTVTGTAEVITQFAKTRRSQKTAGTVTFGPYRQDVGIEILATTSVTWDVATYALPAAQFTAAQVAGLQGVVAGGGKVSGYAKPFGFTLPGQNSGAGVTFINQRPALAAFYGFRVHYLNFDASTWTVTGAKAAAVPTHLNDGVTGASSPAIITFTTAGTNVVPVGAGSSSNALPGVLSSDVIYHPSIARTDDTTKKPLLHLRTYSVGAQNVLQPTGTAFFTNFNADTKSYGRQWAASSPASDQVSTFNASGPSVASNSPFVHPALVEFFYEASVGTIAMCGDSIGAGKGTTYNGATLDQYGMAQGVADALMAASSAKLWEACSFATPSQTFQASCDTAKRVVPVLRPSHLLMHAWSPNNTPSSDAVMLDCRARLLEVAALAEQYRVRLVVVTSGPVNAYSGAQDARIKAQNVWARQMAARGAWGLIDAALLLDPTNSGQIAAAYNGDGLHYNDAFYSAFAALGATSGQFI